MKEKLINFVKSKQGGRVLVIAGIIGIVLIYASTFISPKQSEPEKSGEEFSEEAYVVHLEQQVREIVAAISGDSSSVVTVTLDSGPTYVYAEDKKLNNRSEDSEKSEESQSSYIIIKDSSGAEQALLVTRQLPKVRGVAVVCGPVGEDTREKIEKAIMAALNINSREICIVNRAYQ